ncbi:DUF1697 domain-containing protein [Nocardioides KLBMP 9356]|uniref:DUF1697 domain-containing protein n=1 Tax=Nocardioides potassii TaxID=2911371 RepID=A0ABS9HEI1_9ACTN|nr:DUF1697 domain-containing protein [Nocardioides potassii]MCF6379590.1 DUF1697 domain-containing protein [Nocardioides potassii]
MTATSVAFFRNLNLGQRRSPGREQLLAAFAAEGATDVLSHQSNGTVAFTAPGDPQQLADAVAARLTSVCDYADLAVVRSVAWLDDLGLAALPDGCELTLYDTDDPFPEQLPFFDERAAATVLVADRRHAIVQNHVERRSNGTPLLEKLLDVSATSRGAGTVLRLLDRL